MLQQIFTVPSLLTAKKPYKTVCDYLQHFDIAGTHHLALSLVDHLHALLDKVEFKVDTLPSEITRGMQIYDCVRTASRSLMDAMEKVNPREETTISREPRFQNMSQLPSKNRKEEEDYSGFGKKEESAGTGEWAVFFWRIPLLSLLFLTPDILYS